MNLPLQNLKACTFSLDRKAVDLGRRIIRGYAAAWEIDRIDDRIIPTAFNQTIAERGPRETPDGIRSKIKVAYNHAETIGLPQVMTPDGEGLYTESAIDETQTGTEVLRKVASGTVDTMSFFYDIMDYAYEEVNGRRIRVLKQLKVYEYGPVDFACNEAAVILGLKAMRDTRDFFNRFDPTDVNNMLGDLKAGRVLSAANIDLAQRAMEALQALLTAAQKPDPAPAENQSEEVAPSPEPPAPEQAGLPDMPHQDLVDMPNMMKPQKTVESSTEEDDQLKSVLARFALATRSASEQLRSIS